MNNLLEKRSVRICFCLIAGIVILEIIRMIAGPMDLLETNPTLSNIIIAGAFVLFILVILVNDDTNKLQGA